MKFLIIQFVSALLLVTNYCVQVAVLNLPDTKSKSPLLSSQFCNVSLVVCRYIYDNHSTQFHMPLDDDTSVVDKK
jgi:hypothetical protein